MKNNVDIQFSMRFIDFKVTASWLYFRDLSVDFFSVCFSYVSWSPDSNNFSTKPFLPYNQIW